MQAHVRNSATRPGRCYDAMRPSRLTTFFVLCAACHIIKSHDYDVDEKKQQQLNSYASMMAHRDAIM
jgi:hypothetical protein